MSGSGNSKGGDGAHGESHHKENKHAGPNVGRDYINADSVKIINQGVGWRASASDDGDPDSTQTKRRRWIISGIAVPVIVAIIGFAGILFDGIFSKPHTSATPTSTKTDELTKNCDTQAYPLVPKPAVQAKVTTKYADGDKLNVRDRPDVGCAAIRGAELPNGAIVKVTCFADNANSYRLNDGVTRKRYYQLDPVGNRQRWVVDALDFPEGKKALIPRCRRPASR